jgi:hypothetical protein
LGNTLNSHLAGHYGHVSQMGHVCQGSYISCISQVHASLTRRSTCVWQGAALAAPASSHVRRDGRRASPFPSATNAAILSPIPTASTLLAGWGARAGSAPRLFALSDTLRVGSARDPSDIWCLLLLGDGRDLGVPSLAITAYLPLWAGREGTQRYFLWCRHRRPSFVPHRITSHIDQRQLNAA